MNKVKDILKNLKKQGFADENITNKILEIHKERIEQEAKESAEKTDELISILKSLSC